MDTRKQGGALDEFAESHGIAIIAGDATTYGDGVLVYDSTGDPLEARWSLARALAHASGQPEPERLAERLFASS